MRMFVPVLLSCFILILIIGLIHAKSDNTSFILSEKYLNAQGFNVIEGVSEKELINTLSQFGQGNGPLAVQGHRGFDIHHSVTGNFQLGGFLNFEVIGDQNMAGLPVILVFSANGDYPGISIPGIGTIPLNPPYPFLISGVFDSSGRVHINIPLPNDQSLRGARISTTAIGYDFLSNSYLLSNPQTFAIGQGLVGESCCKQGIIGGPESWCAGGGVSLHYCRLTIEGSVQNCIPDEPRSSSLGLNISRLVPANSSTINQSLIDAVMRDVAASNISRRAYTPGSYICHHFASDLEIFLTSRGYNATFTHYMKFDSNNRTVNDHALTDIHFSDGTILFIEPQTGNVVNMDIDGDGSVEARMYATAHQNGYHPTDDNAKITVYDSKAAAAAAGLRMP